MRRSFWRADNSKSSWWQTPRRAFRVGRKRFAPGAITNHFGEARRRTEGIAEIIGRNYSVPVEHPFASFEFQAGGCCAENALPFGFGWEAVVAPFALPQSCAKRCGLIPTHIVSGPGNAGEVKNSFGNGIF